MTELKNEFVFGIPEELNLKGIPAVCKYRLRLRNNDFARIFLRWGDGGISEHYLVNYGQEVRPTMWTVGENRRG
jgi:hypothetical protein